MGADDWPRHPNKAWQEVLERIRDLGWPRPKWTSNHPTLIMDCPERAPQCRIRAYSTGKGSESAAIAALRLANRCPHRNITDELIQIDELLDAASRLIDGAASLLRRGIIDRRLEDLLALAGDAIEQAEEALLDEEFDELSGELAAMGTAEPEQPTDLLEAADGHLREARLSLRDLPGRSTDVAARRERLEGLATRRRALGDAVHG